MRNERIPFEKEAIEVEIGRLKQTLEGGGFSVANEPWLFRVDTSKRYICGLQNYGFLKNQVENEIDRLKTLYSWAPHKE